MRLLCLFLPGLIFLWVPIFAQEARYHVHGHVLDEQGAGLSGATVLVGEQLTTTDSTGHFQLLLAAPNSVLTVRRIGFFPQRLTLDSSMFSGQHLSLQAFYLQSNAVELPEISISSKPIDWVFKEHFQSNLLDYDFAGEDLLLLVQEGKNYYLRRTTDQGRQLSQLQLPEPAILLHRSCTGDLHVLGVSRAWEITLNKLQTDTLPAYTAHQFRTLIEPCVLEYHGNFVFKKTGPYRQSVQYEYYGSDRRKRLLAVVRNATAEAQLRRRHWEIISGYLTTTQQSFDQEAILNGTSPLLQPDILLQPGNLARLAESNQLMAQVGFFSALALDSVYAPLIRLGDQLYLLDHVNHLLVCIPEIPHQIICAPLSYHRAKGFRQDVLVDHAHGRTYGRFSEHGGQLVLKEIDFETGAARKAYTLTLAPYLAENFNIRNGILYFIGQPNVTIPNRRLYKMNIFSFEQH